MDDIGVVMAGTIEREENSVSKVTEYLVKKYRIVMRGGYWVYRKIKAFLYQSTGFLTISITD